MKREIIPQPKGKSCIVILFPLGSKDSKQVQKLDSEPLQEELNKIAKNLKCEYAVRLNGNTATAEIAFTHQGTITDQDEYDYEMKAINFMKEVDKLELPQPTTEPKCPSHEVQEGKMSNVDFVKRLLNDINLPNNDISHVVGAIIFDTTTSPLYPELTSWGKMSYDLLKEMCELYLETHEQKSTESTAS